MVGEEALKVRSHCEGACARRGVYAVEDGEKEIEAIDEEEQAEVPSSLPNVYQPTQSEYLDRA